MNQTIVILILALILGKPLNGEILISVKNNLDVERIQETVEIRFDELPEEYRNADILIFNESSKDEVLSQKIDIDGDGSNDLLIFQSGFNANETKQFLLVQAAEPNEVTSKVYARFVPERKDDFAWENERIAYRMYGPTLQVEDGDNSGSGIDVWVKSVNKLVLDEWYKGEDYHKDHGEGLDYYKVGTSRGCGGIAILQNDTLLISRNFTDWKIIANGPIRTIFELSYAPWGTDDVSLTEVKRISLDAGQNLNHFQSYLKSSTNMDQLQFVIGIAKRKIDGNIKVEKDQNLLRYWEPEHAEFGITGCALIVPSKNDFSVQEINDHFLVRTSLGNQTLEYYAGACWNRNPEFPNMESWDSYLKSFAKRLNSPLLVTITKN